MTKSKLLFLLGPARSGSTFTMAQLNRSDHVFLLSEINSYTLPTGVRTDDCSTPTFAEAFNLCKAREGNTRQKGSFIPEASRFRTVDELYEELGSQYQVVGEKVALSGPPTGRRFPAEELFDVQLKKHFHAYHLLLLRRPTETLSSTHLKFPETHLRVHFERLLRSFERLFELNWVLPRSRMIFYERLGDTTFKAIFDWLELDWVAVPRIPYTPRPRPDWPIYRQELLSEVPALGRLESLYEELLAATDPSPFWTRGESGTFRSAAVYDRIGSAFRGLIDDLQKGRSFSSSDGSNQMGYACSGLKVVLETLHPLAWESVDHVHPLGTRQDNYRSASFTKKLLKLYAELPLSVLDLGCAGGGFVKEITEAGHLAVGLEGSDYSLKAQRAEWPSIPNRLFTCDCSQPFSIYLEHDGNRERVLFHVITAWEFLEHIHEERLPNVLENVRRHLHPTTGLFIASIHLHSCVNEGIEYHATIRPEWWWRALFLDHGFYPLDRALDYFDEDWVRGPLTEQYALGSFHIVASLSPAGPIVRQLDRLAAHGFEHAHLKRSELKRMLIESRRLASTVLSERDFLSGELERSKVKLESCIAERTAYSFPNLCRAAAVAIERCRDLRVESIAIFGAGKHTEQLLPIWKNLGGPPVLAILVTAAVDPLAFGLPIVTFNDPIPPNIQAVVPSSHRFESAMHQAWLAYGSKIPWVPLWEVTESIEAE